MRGVLLLLLFLPFVSKAQINRSANELTRERVEEYIVTKLFKDLSYKPILYGELKSLEQPRSGLSWAIGHRFEIVDSQCCGG